MAQWINQQFAPARSSGETSPLDPSERCARGGRVDPMEDARSGRGGPTARWMEGTRRYEVPGATAAFLLSGRATVARSAFPPCLLLSGFVIFGFTAPEGT